jgi:hypothetical protein
MTSALTLSVPETVYEQRLRALGAWWCLGSSALQPRVLMEYAPAALPTLREAGL